MSEAAHSYWSASRFESLMLCPGKVVLEDGAPDNANAYAAEGTAAHQVLTWALQEERPASAYLGRLIHLDERGKVCDASSVYSFEVDDDMVEHVQTCIDYCLDLKGDDGVLFADIRVNYSSYLGVAEETAWGTADVIIARGAELIVVDFKYGRGVEVGAEKNPQMSLYALGALQAYQGLVADFTTVRMAISQPRVKKAPSEWDCTVDAIETWGRSTARSAVITCINADRSRPDVADGGQWGELFLRPAEKACKFCKAKASCPALRNEVIGAVFESRPSTADEFERLTTVDPLTQPEDCAKWLSVSLSKVDLIEDWCKAIRAEADRRLLAGEKVPGFKVVQGKKGNRQWSDAKVAEETLKTMRVKLEDMYDFKLISPTSAEKLHKAGTIGPRQWPKVKDLITQSEGKPHVAPESDPRPALTVTPAADDFTDVTVDDLA